MTDKHFSCELSLRDWILLLERLDFTSSLFPPSLIFCLMFKLADYSEFRLRYATLIFFLQNLEFDVFHMS